MRLTAPDGYTAQRSYSVASAPDGGNEFELTVERLDDGEVSTFLHDVVEPGDELEVRGPLGGWFVWDGDEPGLLVGGGSGVVPLMAMLRLAAGRPVATSSASSSRCAARTTCCTPTSSPVRRRRSSTPAAAAVVGPATGAADAADLPAPLAPDTTAYVCGSAGFCNAAGDLLVEAGRPVERIRVERFGPTG